MSELLSHRVVLFAGAGISTEAWNVSHSTLYDEVKEDLGIKEDLPFPDLMARFCETDAGRPELLRRIYRRFADIQSFPSLYQVATRFHTELSSLFLIDSIVTTNWDDYFERECGAIPFVTPEDFVFWSIPRRKVFKIHGSINNLGSIVATREDYEGCHERLKRGLVGSNLRMMLATKTILYVGYSFRDDDFLRLHSLLREELGTLLPRAYVVSLDRQNEQRLRDLGLIPIFTDGTHFISVLKQHLLNDGDHLLSDERLDGIYEALKMLRSVRSRLRTHFEVSEMPDLVYMWSYADGLLHGFQKMITTRHMEFTPTNVK